MSIVISLLHATKGRPDKAALALRMWHDRMINPHNAEYIFACEEDDPSHEVLLDSLAVMPRRFGVLVIEGNYEGSAPAWNAAYKKSSGQLLIQVSEDMEPPEAWDRTLLSRLTSLHGEDWPKHPVVVAVADGFRTDKLFTTFICTRAYAEMQGEFIHPGYQSVFSDNEATYRAYRSQRDGKAAIIEARDLVFFHRHAYHDSSVPFDAVYANQNSADAYSKGAALFAKRNPDAMGKDRRIWQ